MIEFSFNFNVRLAQGCLSLAKFTFIVTFIAVRLKTIMIIYLAKLPQKNNNFLRHFSNTYLDTWLTWPRLYL